MLSLYIFHPSGKVFRSYMKLGSEKLSKPNTDVIFGNIENDTITSYKMYRAKKLSFSKKIFEPAVKRVRKIYLEKDLHPALKEDCTNKEVYYLIPEGSKIELFGYKKR